MPSWAEQKPSKVEMPGRDRRLVKRGADADSGRQAARSMTRIQALAFIQEHGVVLESGRGPIVSFAEKVAGGPIRGSWWGHSKSHEIFALTRAIRDSKSILVCRLVNGKITFVHRRLWPALVRLAPHLPRTRLAMLREVHTESGRHETHEVSFPKWVPALVERQAQRLSDSRARSLLGPWIAKQL